MKPAEEVADIQADPELLDGLHEGDTVRIGDVVMTFHFDALTPEAACLQDAALGERALVYMTKIGADPEGYEVYCNKLRAEHRAEYPDPEAEPYSIEFVLSYGPEYGDYVQHLRRDERGVAMMTRNAMKELLKSGQFQIV